MEMQAEHYRQKEEGGKGTKAACGRFRGQWAARHYVPEKKCILI